jgi:hypothetical protein
MLTPAAMKLKRMPLLPETLRVTTRFRYLAPVSRRAPESGSQNENGPDGAHEANRPGRDSAVSWSLLLRRRRAVSGRSGRRGTLRRISRRRRGGLVGARSRRRSCLAGVTGRSSGSRRSCSLISACGFLLRAGRQHQRGNNGAKSKFGVHRSVPRREARVVLVRLRPITVVPRVPYLRARGKRIL